MELTSHQPSFTADSLHEEVSPSAIYQVFFTHIITGGESLHEQGPNEEENRRKAKRNRGNARKLSSKEACI